MLKSLSVLLEQIISHQQDKIKRLEKQVELLKKLDVLEKSLVNNCLRLSSREIYQITHETVLRIYYSGTVSFCYSILGVSHWGYDNYLKNISYHNKQEFVDIQAREYILMAIDSKGYGRGSHLIEKLLENNFGIT